MKIHTENAQTFDSEQDCQTWIGNRIVRFKLKVQHAQDRDGNIAIGAMRKADGRILDKTVDGFNPRPYDEPLDYYAEPVKTEDKWLAVMKVAD